MHTPLGKKTKKSKKLKIQTKSEKMKKQKLKISKKERKIATKSVSDGHVSAYLIIGVGSLLQQQNQ